jgi:hypothetical protein
MCAAAGARLPSGAHAVGSGSSPDCEAFVMRATLRSSSPSGTRLTVSTWAAAAGRQLDALVRQRHPPGNPSLPTT